MNKCAITEGSGGTRADWLVARCGRLEVDLLIVREKALETRELVELTQRIVATGLRVLVAGRVEVAVAAGAAGVHLSARAGELTPGRVRAVMPGAYVTVSCHAVSEVVRAREGGADAVLFGPVFGKWVDGVEVVPGCGLRLLEEARVAAGGMEVFALGGINAGNVGELRGVGVAGIRMFFGDAG